MEELERRAESYELEEHLEQSELLDEGANKSVYRSPRNRVVKPSEYRPHQFDPEEHRNFLENINGLPYTQWSIRDLEEYGLWSDTVLIVQEQSDMDLEEGIKKYGDEEMIREASRTWTRLREQGMRYRDFKPANIHLFNSINGKELRPVDILDSAAYEIADEIRPICEARCLESFLYGPSLKDGFIDISETSTQEAVEIFADESYLMDEPDGSSTRELREAFAD